MLRLPGLLVCATRPDTLCVSYSLNNLWLETGLNQMALGQFSMILIGMLLLFLAINKKFEPLLLVPIGFGGILANIPNAGMAYSGVENAVFASSGNLLDDIALALQLGDWESPKQLLAAYDNAGPTMQSVVL